MPTVRVETSLSAEFFPQNFMQVFLVALAEILGKDKKLMKYVFDTSKDMTIVSTRKLPFFPTLRRDYARGQPAGGGDVFLHH